MASVGKGSTPKDIELKEVQRNRSREQINDQDSDSETDTRPHEAQPMLDKSKGEKPIPAQRTPSNPNLLSSPHSQKSLEALGGRENPPVTKPRKESSKSSGIPTQQQPYPTKGYQPDISGAEFNPQVEQGVDYYTGEINNTTLGDTSQVLQQTFNFQPQGPEPLKMGEVEDQPSPTGFLAWAGFGCSVFALACLCVSFASPYWMQTYPMSFSSFQNMGLWEICMKDYMHHKDDSQTVYDGCWWVFDRAEKYEKLKEWLLPPWFITCQVMVTMNLISQMACIGIIALIFLHCCPIINHEYHQSYAMFAAAGLCFFITILTVITGVIYGVFCGDRQWMPRPDLNFISWGYGFLIIQGIISTAAGVCYFLEAQKAFNELDRRDQEYTKAVLDMEMTQQYPPTYSYGAPSYGQPSYDAGSNYGADKQSYTSQPSFDPGKQSYASQPSYDPYAPQSGLSYSEKGSSYEKGGSYSEKPPYPAHT